MSSLIAVALLGSAMAAQAVTLAPSDRVDINLGAQPWKYIKQYQNPAGHPQVPNDDSAAAVNFNDSAWETVGIPHAANDFTTFINQESGGGQGSLDGDLSWYRTTLKDSASYAGKKVMVEFEGAHTGDRVYINGRFIPGTGALNQPGQADAGATHVVGFVPHIVDLTPYLKYDGTDVIAVKVRRGGGDFFEDPGFSGAFRFGQAEAGLFRPVKLHVTNLVHIPENVYAGQSTWGTYVGTSSISTDQTSAVVRVQTNVANERDTPATVTLTTQIVDAQGNVVASDQKQQTLAPHTVPGDTTPVFDESLTVKNPTLWYPNASIYGKPYLYKVLHTVSIDGTVVDAKQSTLGIRIITWDKDFPYVNGKKHYAWGAAGRYDYPALGSSVPEEQQWRDLQQLAAAGGNVWRPGHSPSSPEFVDAADALGVFIVQPSGDGENGFANVCATGDKVCADSWTLKRELHRDIVIRDRSHPSILAWETDNGQAYTPFAQELRTLARNWDSIAPRAAADRTPNPANGDFIGCSKAGCETYLHATQFPNTPAWGAEYWGNGSQRHAFDYELAFALNYLVPYSQSRKVGTFGMAQWYFADTPGETGNFAEGTEDATHYNVAADTGQKYFMHNVRSLGASMVDQNRFPRMLYYIYESVWMPYSVHPMVKLAHHWNRSGDIQVNAFSNCPAVRLLVNGVQQGADQHPNSWDTIDQPSYDLINAPPDPATGKLRNGPQAQATTQLPGQVHWNLTWQSGTATAQCIDASGNAVADGNGAPVADTLTTAGAPDHIELDVVPELVKPDGTSFAITANGSDAAFIVAKVVDANGVVVPVGSDVNVDFEVTSGDSLVTYQGGTQQLVDWAGGSTTAGDGSVQPNYGYHAPGSHELKFEGGLQKIALRTKFVPGTVTVTATAAGLAAGSASFNIVNVPTPATPSGPPSIIANPVEDDVTVGFAGHFAVTASGAPPLSFTWKKNGVAIDGANSASYNTPASAQGDDGSTYSVVVHNAFGDQESSPAPLRVFAAQPVAIVSQPVAQNVDVGETAHFAVTATGSPKLTYQWMKGGQPIVGATGPAYDTAPLTLADNGTQYAVVVTNPVTVLPSTAASLTVNAARPPSIVTQPGDIRANPGQPATFTVAVTGTAPFHYVWKHAGQPVGDDAASLTINAVGQPDTGAYTVTVSNTTGDANAVTSRTAQLSLAPPGANLAREKLATASSVQDVVSTKASFAVDGDSTGTRWASAENDTEWLTVDLGSVRSFDRVVLKWEAAYGAQYKIQYSNDPNTGYQDAYSQTGGVGGTEDITFARVSGRYVRMQGVKRGSPYGYSLYEFEIYDSPTCCDAGDRYTLKDATHVIDNLSGLAWERTQRGLSDQGAQYTQSKAAADCKALGARLPTLDEALAISGQNLSTSAFPNAWTIWTSTNDPADATYAFQVASDGSQLRLVAENNPSHGICVVGTTVVAPNVTNQPVAQTAGAGRSAHFAIAATGVGPLSYEWYKNGNFVSATPTGAYATPALLAADNKAVYVVKVVSAQGLATYSASAVLTVDSSNSGFDPPNGSAPPDGGGGNLPPNPPGTGTPGDGHGGINIATKATATATSSENAGNLGANFAIDGNFTTRWASTIVPMSTLTVDFGTPKTFDHVILRWEVAYSTAYTIDVSNDNVNWQTVAGPIAGRGGVETQNFAAQTARYVRMNSTAKSTSGPNAYGVSLWEFEVYQAAATSTPPPVTTSPVSTPKPSQQPQQPQQSGPVTGTVPATGNIALKHAVTASSNENAVTMNPSSITDGDPTTRWSSAWVDNQWIQIDLGSVQSIDKVILSWESAHAATYRIDVSTDGTTWNTAYDNENGVGGLETVTFPAISARYVRMSGIKRSGGYGFSLWEMGVYAANGAGGLPPNPGSGSNDPSQGGNYTTYPGFVGTQLRNVTNGVWRDDQIFVEVLGRDPVTSVFSWVKPDGSYKAVSPDDNAGPGHLTKNGNSYPNYAFTLAQAKLLKLPKLSSGRIFVSVGEPLYMKINKAEDGSLGYAGPDPLNPTDPNIATHYDWYEYTWADNGIWINTTQVDQFAIPLTLDLYAGGNTRHQSAGIAQSRAQIFALYNQEVPAEFRIADADPVRILAPGKDAFNAGKPQAHYFDGYVDEVWNYYGNHVLEMSIGAKQFEGVVVDGVLTFRHTNWAQTHEPNEAEGMLFNIAKPTTQDVFEGKGALADSHDPWGVEGQLQAQLCAALNRHVAEDVSQWKNESLYYLQAPANFYSRFWHAHNIEGKAYGFSYDDVSDHSSSLIDGQPEHLEMGIGW